ncbi:MAG: hypothetical protein WC632_06525 [Candidatus Margulisiibacteriota bacterium]
MNRAKSLLLLVVRQRRMCLWLISCSLLVNVALAVPQYLSYQGVLRDSGSNLITGTKAMTFRVYDAVTAGTKKFEMISSEVVVSGGLYNVMLGPIGFAELEKGPRWLEVEVGGEILTPRIELVTVAYAVSAASAEAAETVGGFSANLTATANNLLPLDSDKQLKGMSVSAEAAGNNYALFVNGGKIGIKTGSNMSIGTGTITALSGLEYVTVNNTSVNSTSTILLTVGPNAAINSNAGIKVTLISSGAWFKVGTMNGQVASADIPFYYMIIN